MAKRLQWQYMTNYLEKRLDPRLLVPGVRSIVSLALNYAPAQQLPKGEYQIAAYALGLDYHDLMKQKMRGISDKDNRTVATPQTRRRRRTLSALLL